MAWKPRTIKTQNNNTKVRGERRSEHAPALSHRTRGQCVGISGTHARQLLPPWCGAGVGEAVESGVPSFVHNKAFISFTIKLQNPIKSCICEVVWCRERSGGAERGKRAERARGEQILWEEGGKGRGTDRRARLLFSPFARCTMRCVSSLCTIAFERLLYAGGRLPMAPVNDGVANGGEEQWEGVKLDTVRHWWGMLILQG
jgi:hypothetical protein